MEDLKTDKLLDNEFESNIEKTYISSYETNLIEYKEIDEPCVSLTIIGQNKLTDAEIFFKRGIKYSIKAFFSTIILTIISLFI